MSTCLELQLLKLFFLRLKQGGILHLSSKPQLPCQVVMTNLLRELDREVPVGPIVGNAFIHDLIDNVQHIVLQEEKKTRIRKLELTQKPVWGNNTVSNDSPVVTLTGVRTQLDNCMTTTAGLNKKILKLMIPAVEMHRSKR